MKKKKTYYRCHFCGAIVEDTGYFCCDDQKLSIGKCTDCKIIQQTDFLHVNLDYYRSTSYANKDINQIRDRERDWNRKRVEKIYKLIPGIQDKKILDYGCGPGGFLEAAQPVFTDLYGFDLNSKYCKIHNRMGWKCYSSLELIPKDINVITLFHVLEHVKKPWALLNDLSLQFPECEYYVIEVPNTTEALMGYFRIEAYAKNHYNREHIWYFSNETLEKVIKRAGLKTVVNTQLQRYSLANHLGWLKDGKGGGQYIWEEFNEYELNRLYEKVLCSNSLGDSVFIIAK
jgi:2-polyprenyl-3-methyl-5-hydroxy-6-metoxy-1,4-benzoquinol methylase